jgi:hypothetical protein
MTSASSPTAVTVASDRDDVLEKGSIVRARRESEVVAERDHRTEKKFESNKLPANKVF